MSIARTSSTAGDMGKKAQPRNLMVAEAPESYADDPSGSPARGIIIALAASVLIWGGIAALIF